jgi:hypothetical protein
MQNVVAIDEKESKNKIDCFWLLCVEKEKSEPF